MTISAIGIRSSSKGSKVDKNCTSNNRKSSSINIDVGATAESVVKNDIGISNSKVPGDTYDNINNIGNYDISEFDQIYLKRLLLGDIQTLITVSEVPSPHCITLSTALASLKRKREDLCIRHYGSISVRDSFLHCAIDNDYRLRCKLTIVELKKTGISDDDLFLLYPKIPRFVLYNYRKYHDDYLRYSVEHCLDIVKWYNSDYFPIKDVEPDLRRMLNQGTAYWIGRDKNHRPILVVRFTSETLCPLLFERTIIFSIEWAKKYLFIPSVSETAVVWIDITKINLTKIPYSDVQSICSKLTYRYPFHLDHFYILHDSVFIQTCTPIIRTFMTELQRLKIKIHRKAIPSRDIDLYYNKLLVDQKFGGTRKSIDRFYPFPVLSNDVHDSQFLQVWDVSCLHGYPEIENTTMPICINTSEMKHLFMKLSLKYEYNTSVKNFERKLTSYSTTILKERCKLFGDSTENTSQNYGDSGNFSLLKSVEENAVLLKESKNSKQPMIQDGESPIYAQSSSSMSSWLCPVPCLTYACEKSEQRLTAEFQLLIKKGG